MRMICAHVFGAAEIADAILRAAKIVARKRAVNLSHEFGGAVLHVAMTANGAVDAESTAEHAWLDVLIEALILSEDEFSECARKFF